MILVFTFLGLLLIISITFFILIMSNIKIKIQNFKIKKFKLNKDYKIVIQIYFLDKFKILSIKLNDKKIRKAVKNNKFKNISSSNILTSGQTLHILKELNIRLEKLKLIINIGLTEADITSYLVGTISGIISIILPYFTKNNNKEQIKYKVIPNYNKNTLDIYLESIISIKIVHIIYIIYNLVKKGRDKNGRTSNRRTYVCSHGFN